MKNLALEINRRYMLAILGTILITFHINAYANVSDINDLKPNASAGSYTVVGGDPYIIFKPNIEEQRSNTHEYLIFDRALSHKNVAIQLFFKPEGSGFNPQYYLEFTAPNTPFALRIPKEVRLSQKQLRIDFVQCNKCDLTFSKLELASQTTQKSVIEIDVTQNGSLKIDSLIGFNLSNSNWLTNDLDGDTSSFKINGTDPYIASQPLNLSTSGLSGVYFKLERPISDSKHLDFQLFYATENNPFKAGYSSIGRLQANNQSNLTTTTSIQEFELFFPLAYLNLETPKDQILKRIRLDIPLIEGEWSLKESKVIHLQQAPEYSAFIPKQLLQHKRQRLTGKALAKKVVSNVLADKGFIVSLLLLLALIITLSVKVYRK